jgi:hypothetical protein
LICGCALFVGLLSGVLEVCSTPVHGLVVPLFLLPMEISQADNTAVNITAAMTAANNFDCLLFIFVHLLSSAAPRRIFPNGGESCQNSIQYSFGKVNREFADKRAGQALFWPNPARGGGTPKISVKTHCISSRFPVY